MIMDFDAAIKAHLEWKSRLTEYLCAPDGSLSESDAGRDDLCELGRWLRACPAIDEPTLHTLAERRSGRIGRAGARR
jgi:hypothetical protein